MPGPGEKRAKRRSVRTGRIGETRVAWSDLPNVKTIVYLPAEDDSDPEALRELGQTVVLSIGASSGRVAVNLTSLTQSELAAFAQTVAIAIATAEPVCILRDDDALEAAQHGEYSHSRLYRAVPRVFVRKGDESPDNQVVRSRLESVLDMARSLVFDPGSYFEQRGIPFLKRDEAGRGTEDDVTALDEPS